jgi:hypothetical protein
VKVEENEDRQNSEERRKGEDRRCVIVWKSLEKKKKKCRGGQLGKFEALGFFYFLFLYFNGAVRTSAGRALDIFLGPHPHPAPHRAGNHFTNEDRTLLCGLMLNAGRLPRGRSVPVGPAHP